MPHTLQHRVGTNPIRQLLDARHTLVATLGREMRCAEFEGELLPLLVAAHRDDTSGAHFFGGQDTKQPDRAVAHDNNRRVRLHVCRRSGEPPGA